MKILHQVHLQQEKIRFNSILRLYTSRNSQSFKNLMEDNESTKVKKKSQETFQEAQYWKGFSLNYNKPRRLKIKDLQIWLHLKIASDVEYLYNGKLVSHKKEWNNAICSNRDGPRHYHPKWYKSETSIISYCLYVESKMNLFTQQKETHRHRKQTYGDHRGKQGRGRDKLGCWD